MIAGEYELAALAELAAHADPICILIVAAAFAQVGLDQARADLAGGARTEAAAHRQIDAAQPILHARQSQVLALLGQQAQPNLGQPSRRSELTVEPLAEVS